MFLPNCTVEMLGPKGLQYHRWKFSIGPGVSCRFYVRKMFFYSKYGKIFSWTSLIWGKRESMDVFVGFPHPQQLGKMLKHVQMGRGASSKSEYKSHTVIITREKAPQDYMLSAVPVSASEILHWRSRWGFGYDLGWDLFMHFDSTAFSWSFHLVKYVVPLKA